MATRRARSLIQNVYSQSLKSERKNRRLLALNCNYNSVMQKVSHRPLTEELFKIQSWMKFNSNTFNGVQIVAGLLKNKRFCSIGSCTFKIYSISVDNLWTENLITTVSGTNLPDNRFSATVGQSVINPIELSGDVTFKLDVDIVRVNKTYSESFFFNHLGIYDSFLRLKQDVEYLDIIKLDE